MHRVVDTEVAVLLGSTASQGDLMDRTVNPLPNDLGRDWNPLADAPTYFSYDTETGSYVLSGLDEVRYL